MYFVHYFCLVFTLFNRCLFGSILLIALEKWFFWKDGFVFELRSFLWSFILGPQALTLQNSEAAIQESSLKYVFPNFWKDYCTSIFQIFCLLIINHLLWFLRVSKIDLPETTILRHTLLTRLAFTCSKSTIEMLEQGVKSVKSYNEDTRITSVTPFWCLYC